MPMMSADARRLSLIRLFRFLLGPDGPVAQGRPLSLGELQKFAINNQLPSTEDLLMGLAEYICVPLAPMFPAVGEFGRFLIVTTAQALAEEQGTPSPESVHSAEVGEVLHGLGVVGAISDIPSGGAAAPSPLLAVTQTPPSGDSADVSREDALVAEVGSLPR